MEKQLDVKLKPLRRALRRRPKNDEDIFYKTIYEHSEESQFHKTRSRFLPVDAIDKVFALVDEASQVTKSPSQRVLDILRKEEVEIDADVVDDASLVDFILSQARRLFLVCLQSNERHLHTKMAMFMLLGITDDQLPFRRFNILDLEFEETRGDHPFVQVNRELGEVEDMELWRHIDIDQFFHHQFMFLAPILSATTKVHDLGQRVMPFISAGSPSQSQEGTFGTVRRYEVHHAHFRDEGQKEAPSNCVLAVKEFKKDKKGGASQWEKEIRILEKVNILRHNNIVRFVTAFRHGEGSDLDHFICFEWADGGNLADLWEEDPQPILSVSLIQDVIRQLLGLAQALEATHYFKGPAIEGPEESFIHGDLKPRNILRFRDGGRIGTLKLADWGEARKYGVNTAYGTNTATRHNTTGVYGTRRYEPPEVETGLIIDDAEGTKTVRSRLYDTWSFGCFSLEFIIWLLHGMEGLKSFRSDSVGDYGLSDSFYEVNHERLARVHGVVNHWMDHLEREAICRIGTSALGDLLDIVRHGLIVIKLPRGGGSIDTKVKTLSRFVSENSELPAETKDNVILSRPVAVPHPTILLETPDDGTHPSICVDESELVGPLMISDHDCSDGSLDLNHTNIVSSTDDVERFRTIELVHNLRRMTQVKDVDGYWFQDLPRSPIPPTFREKAYRVTRKLPARVRGNYQFPDLDPEDWRLGLDNEFATKTFERLSDTLHWSPSQLLKVTKSLCQNCQDFQAEIWSPLFNITYSTEWLSERAASKSCDLCVLLWQVCQDNASTRHASVRFERRESTLRISDRRFPVLSLFRDHGARSVVADIQTGFSELPQAGTDLHFEILRGWVDHCDNTHWKDPRCRPSRFKKSAAGSLVKSPTRLIAVGTGSESTVRLQEMDGLEGDDWVALSYQWGAPPHFSTTRQNLNDMYAGIEISTLPQTFQDAVAVTRALQRPYLWIDSVCIIQGPDGDFEKEATTMEDVFNGAYCVLAACCAEDQRSGFLSSRVPRHRVTLDPQHNDYGAIHVCQTIENFGEHVLQGGLAHRGWVLQEHALARRTIFFTKHQTYWECGHGVRCETMATLANDHASLLGDPDFPKRLEPAEHGEFVMRLQELLKQYSRLGLSRDYDRPTAINSLQQRLMRVMNLQGDYGAFHSDDNPGLLPRSLLWHRSLDVSTLNTIAYAKDREVPSWSWMSCSGPIDYFPLTFFGFDWSPLEAIWSDAKSTVKKTYLGATVQTLDLDAANPFEADLIFDVPAKVDKDKVMAVVLGMEKGDTTPGDKQHYILAVTSKEAWGHALYARVGSGHVPGRCLVGQPEKCSLI